MSNYNNTMIPPDVEDAFVIDKMFQVKSVYTDFLRKCTYNAKGKQTSCWRAFSYFFSIYVWHVSNIHHAECDACACVFGNVGSL